MYQNCEALVLRHTRFSETSLVVTLFTREYGRIDALAKGARRPSSPLRGHFDLFSLEEVTIFLRHRSGLDLATEAGLIREPAGLRNDPVRFAAAGILAELLLAGSLPHDPHPAAYEAAVKALREIDAGLYGHQPLIVGILEILREFGFLPRLENCPRCGRDAPKEGALSGRHGGLICTGCAGGMSLLRPAEAASLRYLLRQNTQTPPPQEPFWRLPRVAGAGVPVNAELNFSKPACRAVWKPGKTLANPVIALPGGGLGIVSALGGYCREVLNRPCRSFAVFAGLQRGCRRSGIRPVCPER